MNNFDILIVAAEKDFNKIPFCLSSIQENIEGFSQIHIITPIPFEINGGEMDIINHLDRNIINFNFDLFTGNIALRQGWYKQQFIKLFQKVTQVNYLTIDADTLITKKLDVFEGEKPIFYLDRDQNHPPYFDYIQRMFGFGREYNYSFINEIMFFNRNIIELIISSTNLTEHGFLLKTTKIINQINHKSSFSEYELYGNYVMKFYPELYSVRKMNALDTHKKREWTEDEIKEIVDKKEYDKISIHTWLT